MKKGKKGNAVKHKIAPLKQSGFIASTVAFITVAMVSLGTFGFNLAAMCKYTPDDGEFIKDLGNVIISALTFITSVIGSWRSIVKLAHDSFNREFIEDERYKKSIIETIGNNYDDCYIKNGYTWGEYKNARYLYSEKVDNALASLFPADRSGEPAKIKSDLLLKVTPKIQPLSSDQNEALYQKVKEKRAAGKNIFNSNLVRLRTDLFTDGVFSTENAAKTEKLSSDYTLNADNLLKFTDIRLVDVEKTDYYSNMTSNDMLYDRLFKYDHSSVFYGKDMTADGDVLYNLSESPAANIIGVTTLAITSDGKIVINKQDNNNDVNNDCFVPSGTGSADFYDLIACRKLEKKLRIPTYANKLQELLSSYKTLNLRKNRNGYLKYVKSKIINFNTEKEQLRNESLEQEDFYTAIFKQDDKFIGAKKVYETGIKASKERKQLKRYCKNLNKYTCSFRNFITYGMVRELVEESHVCKTFKHKIDLAEMKSFMDKTEICGYIRILDRGGKPDFFGITYLNLTENELKERFMRIGLKVAKKELKLKSAITDYSEVCSQVYVPLQKLLECENFEELFTDTGKENKEKKIKISLQLHYLLTIMKKRLQSQQIKIPTTN